MRSTSDDISVRLYRLDPDGAAVTILYGTLAEARAAAAALPEAVWPELFIQTDNDVVAWLDLEEG